MNQVILILYDSHNHSIYSHDGRFHIREIAETAISAGLSGIMITDHCDINELAQAKYPSLQKMRECFNELESVRQEFSHTLEIGMGMELGQTLYDPVQGLEAAKMLPYDCIILALHQMHGWDDLYDIDYSLMSEQDIDRLMVQYFSDLLRMFKHDDFDIAAHLNLPVRYLKRRLGYDLNLEKYSELIDKLLLYLAEHKKGIEINTSGLRNNHGECMPPLWIVRRFRELGGEIVTIGSDSHRLEHIGSGLQSAMTLLKNAGLTHYAWYRGRKPCFITIDDNLKK